MIFLKKRILVTVLAAVLLLSGVFSVATEAAFVSRPESAFFRLNKNSSAGIYLYDADVRIIPAYKNLSLPEKSAEIRISRLPETERIVFRLWIAEMLKKIFDFFVSGT